MGADFHLPILAGEERANATKTYTNCTAVCTILASELLDQPWQQDAGRVAEAFGRSLEQVFSRRHEVDEFCRGMKTLEIVGRGAALGGAIIGALCVREMTTWRANAQSGGAFRHGPLLDVDGSHAAIILALGTTAEMGHRMAKDCVAKGGKAVVVADRDPIESSERLLTIKVEAVPDGWEGLTSVLVPQALTASLIERLGSSYVRSQTTIQ